MCSEVSYDQWLLDGTAHILNVYVIEGGSVGQCWSGEGSCYRVKSLAQDYMDCNRTRVTSVYFRIVLNFCSFIFQHLRMDILMLPSILVNA